MKTTNAVAYSYIRFSHPDQAKGDSLRRQTELRDSWLARNHATLDTSLSLEDKGVSGYSGDHRDNPDRHALAAFVALVKAGRIARGSYLVVENLDRLSREDIIPALSLLLDLIQSGVRVVQLLPAETVFDAKSSPMMLMMAIMELSRGHSESAMKSERGGRAWQDKKRRAAANGEPLTSRVPAWLRLVGGRVEAVAPAAEAVRRIYRMATDGHGLTVITKRLNAEQVPALGDAEYWHKSYVAKILSNRAVVGEYQPYKGRAGKRQPDGAPIAGYYPAVITEEEWYAARASVSGRLGKAGRLSKDGVNVFGGLLFDARDGGTVHIVNKGKKAGGRLLASYKGMQGVEGCRATSFPFDTFERAVLSCLREIDPHEVLPHKDEGADKTLSLAGRLLEVEAEIEKVKARLQARYSDAVADVLERHEAERKTLAGQLAEARQEAASPLGAAWGECRTLIDAIDKAPDADDARVRLRAALRRIVEGVWCLFVSPPPKESTARKRSKDVKPGLHGARRFAAVQVFFVGGARRDYLILRRAAAGGRVAARPAEWSVRSLASMARPGELDLRKPEHAARLEAALLAADLPPA